MQVRWNRQRNRYFFSIGQELYLCSIMPSLISLYGVITLRCEESRRLHSVQISDELQKDAERNPSPGSHKHSLHLLDCGTKGHHMHRFIKHTDLKKI
jgi:hypothetical protein